MQIVPNFWKYFQQPKQDVSAIKDDDEFYQFQFAVCELEKDFCKFQNLLKRLQMFRKKCQLSPEISNEFGRFDETLRFTLLSQLPANFERIIYLFYSTSFKVFVNSHGMCKLISQYKNSNLN